MSLKIRLSRGGTKKRPHYSIVVAESRSPRDGRFIDQIGYYSPMLPKEHADRLKIDLEKAKTWLGKGATPSDRVHRFLALVGMPGTDDILPAELSGGMRRRVGIARALIMEPEVVFFDEPTAGLDPTNARLVAELIATLRAGVCHTAIVVTHDLEFANMVADQMAILHHGRFADLGTPAEIRASANTDVRRFLAGELRED